jgi:hypothetical protein
MLTMEVEMTAVACDAGRKTDGAAELTRTETVMLVAGFIALAVVVLVIGALAVWFW